MENSLAKNEKALSKDEVSDVNDKIHNYNVNHFDVNTQFFLEDVVNNNNTETF